MELIQLISQNKLKEHYMPKIREEEEEKEIKEER
jgi:hypothetical protein